MSLRVKIIYLSILLLSGSVLGQVATERFGKNRLQFAKKKWHYIKTNNFDIYFNDSMDRMAEFVAIEAESALPALENVTGYSLRNRVEVVLYASFNDYLASNLGKHFSWQESDGLTPTVNSKIALYYNGYQSHLANQVREGITHYLFRLYVLNDMSDDPTQDKSSQSIPPWLFTGYVAYRAENWNTALDDKLRNLMNNADYSSFDQFYAKHPLLASHAFWYYVELLKGKEAPAALLNFLKITRNVKTSFNTFFSLKEKAVKLAFMEYMKELYSTEEEVRETSVDGDELVSEKEDEQTKYYNFVVNPNEDQSGYAYVKYHRGITKVIYVDDNSDANEIVSLGYKFNKAIAFKNIPVLAWNNAGDRLAIAYPQEQKIKVLIYDTKDKYKGRTFTLDKVENVQSMKYDFQDNKLIMSALRHGQTDIYIYHLDKNQLYQITNDPYDDLDPSPLLFSNKTGILYSSNRPESGTTKDKRELMLVPSKHYNIFLVDDWLEGNFRNVNKVTNISDADAFFPIQYNNHYFSFLSDINGIQNRYLGRLFSTNKKTRKIVVIGGETFLDASDEQIQKILNDKKLNSIDTSYAIAFSKDSSTIFPISNLASSIYESRASGPARKITQVFYNGDYKTAYAILVDKGISESKLDTLPLSAYLLNQNIPRISPIAFPTIYDIDVDTSTNTTFLIPNFPMASASRNATIDQVKANLYTYGEELSNTQMFKYKRRRFHMNFEAKLESGMFTDKLQPYANGFGPILSSVGSPLALSPAISITDIAEDYEAFMGIKFGMTGIDFSNLFDKTEFSMGFNNYRRRLDWGVSYRLSQRRMRDIYSQYALQSTSQDIYIKQITHYFDINFSYPLDVIRSIRLKTQIRNEQYVYLSNTRLERNDPTFSKETKSRTTLINRLEWVYDNSLSTMTNIYEGLRYKAYLDWLVPVQDNTDFAASGNIDPNIINIGTDVRYYYPIFRDITFAARAALDMSLGDKRILYYVGGVDGWFQPSFNQSAIVDDTKSYAYQALALNLRGYQQNGMNGSSALTFNFEARVPSTSLTSQYINSVFLRNLQLIIFTDLGTAWTDLAKIARPTYIVRDDNNPISFQKTEGGIGPFIGGFGTGLRMRLFGQYLKFDVAWNFDNLFSKPPLFYFSLGVDF